MKGEMLTDENCYAGHDGWSTETDHMKDHLVGGLRTYRNGMLQPKLYYSDTIRHDLSQTCYGLVTGKFCDYRINRPNFNPSHILLFWEDD